jgi:hypothetical protein
MPANSATPGNQNDIGSRIDLNGTYRRCARWRNREAKQSDQATECDERFPHCSSPIESHALELVEQMLIEAARRLVSFLDHNGTRRKSGFNQSLAVAFALFCGLEPGFMTIDLCLTGRGFAA